VLVVVGGNGGGGCKEPGGEGRRTQDFSKIGRQLAWTRPCGLWSGGHGQMAAVHVYPNPHTRIPPPAPNIPTHMYNLSQHVRPRIHTVAYVCYKSPLQICDKLLATLLGGEVMGVSGVFWGLLLR